MNNVLLVPNIARDENLVFTNSVISSIGGRVNLIMSKRFESSGIKATFLTDEQMWEEADTAIVLGGDGTILNVAAAAAVNNVSVLGVNLGKLGFLTELERHETDIYFDKLLSGEYLLESRMMLEVGMESAEQQYHKFHALNDVVVSRGGLSRLVNLNVLVDGVSVVSYVADGVIVSTSTGSTAYALSAGGPIIDPAVNAMQIIPICSHGMSARSVIVQEDKIIEIMPQNNEFENIINVDGLDGISLKDDYKVSVSKSPHTLKLIKISGRNFYDILRSKLINRF